MTDPVTTLSLGELANHFAAVARSLLATSDLPTAFAMISELGVEAVPGAEHAGVTVLRRGKFDTPTATSDLPPRVDAIQYELGSGPCVDAVLDDAVYRSGDLEVDTRWPQFGVRAVAETGVHSMLSFRLLSEDEAVLAALNLYAESRDAFDESATWLGLVFATHGSLALAAAGRQERIQNLEQALASNREIGIAIGVLMSTQLVTEQQAFDLLRMASQRSHRKLRDVAAGVVETGTLDLR
jgi:hypothetical protein